MRSARLISTCGALFLLLPLCFAGTDKPPSKVKSSDSPPQAATIQAASEPANSGQIVATQREQPPNRSLIHEISVQLAELRVSGLAIRLGMSVAISGNAVVVGDPYGGPQGNEAYVYVEPSGGWGDMTQTAILIPSDADPTLDTFGDSVAISGDTIVVGASQYDGGYSHGSGKIYVYVKPAGGWVGQVTETAQLTASDGILADALGTSVSISGNTIVGGAPGTQPYTSPGSAYVFVEPPSGWKTSTETAKLTTTDGQVGDQFGTSVSISGNTAVGGAPTHGAGTAYVFVEPSGGWVTGTQTAELTSAGNISGGLMGSSVSIYGTTIVAGAPYATVGANQYQGAAFILVEPPGGWRDMIQSATLVAPDGHAQDSFGSSVAISGERVAVGAPYYSRGYLILGIPAFWNEGAVYSFSKASSTWSDVSVAEMHGAASRYYDMLGTAVAATDRYVVAGAPYFGRFLGTTYIFGLQ
jgi:hypothetical protein